MIEDWRSKWGAASDPWLSVGLSDGDAGGALSSIGINWELWTELNGIEVTDGAVFWMSPDSAPGGSLVTAQLTVASGSSGTMVAGMQGRSTTGPDWQVDGVTWSFGSAAAPPNCCAQWRPRISIRESRHQQARFSSQQLGH